VPSENVQVICHLCPGRHGITTTWDRAPYVAMDHALDHHRDELLADPERVEQALIASAA
jgi:hypothetical protein